MFSNDDLRSWYGGGTRNIDRVRFGSEFISIGGIKDIESSCSSLVSRSI